MPEKLTPSERVLRAQIAAHTSWANTIDRSARTAKARQALEDKWLLEANGDPRRAENARKAFYKSIAFKSAQARKHRKAAAGGAA
jgi:hypothetical protein